MKQVSYTMAVKLSRELMRQHNLEVEIVELGKHQIDNCCANAECGKTEEKMCIYTGDDFEAIFNKMVEADGVLFIVPKYAPYPSRFMSFVERLVAISWWGFVQRDNISDFVLNKKLAGLICFASSPVTESKAFDSLFSSFESIGFDLLKFADRKHGIFINRSNDNEEQILKNISRKLTSREIPGNK